MINELKIMTVEGGEKDDDEDDSIELNWRMCDPQVAGQRVALLARLLALVRMFQRELRWSWLK